MSDKRIIFPDGEGGVAIIVPSDNCGLTVEEIAAKDVPEGVAYQIIDAADVSSDRSFRYAWTYVEDEK